MPISLNTSAALLTALFTASAAFYTLKTDAGDVFGKRAYLLKCFPIIVLIVLALFAREKVRTLPLASLVCALWFSACGDAALTEHDEASFIKSTRGTVRERWEGRGAEERADGKREEKREKRREELDNYHSLFPPHLSLSISISTHTHTPPHSLSMRNASTFV
jgi:hypothetical protein